MPYIQNKYSFEERPQSGIVVKSSSANKVSLSPDNAIGPVSSHVMLAYVGPPTYPLEWVREDRKCVQANNDRMPIQPGVYYLEILETPRDAQGVGQFAVDPLLEQIDEAVLLVQSGIEQEAQLQQLPAPKTLRLWENHRFPLVEGRHFTVDYATGQVKFTTRLPPQARITADYFYPVPSLGPINYSWNTADFKTLPGVVLAFGKRGRQGDKVAIRVYPDRVDTAMAYGGRFDLTLEFDVLSQDTNQMEELADLTMMYLWGEKRASLSSEGIELTDISMGGENEEVYDETGELFVYSVSMSLQIQTDWEIHIPLPLTISRVTPTTSTDDQNSSPIQPTRSTTIVGDVRSKLFFGTAPYLEGRNNNFERIL